MDVLANREKKYNGVGEYEEDCWVQVREVRTLNPTLLINIFGNLGIIVALITKSCIAFFIGMALIVLSVTVYCVGSD